MTKTFIDISVDLETWHNAPGADLRSIGLAPIYVHGKFHGHSADTFYRAVESTVVQILPDGIQITEYGLIRHPKTIKWWGEQGQTAQDAFKNPTELSTAIMELLGYLQRITGYDDPSKCRNLRLWAHGSHYDCPILAAVIAALGLDEMWFYRAPRDTRTIFDNAGIKDHSAYITSFTGPDFIKHHALHDAQVQGFAVADSCEIISRWKEAYLSKKSQLGDSFDFPVGG